MTDKPMSAGEYLLRLSEALGVKIPLSEVRVLTDLICGQRRQAAEEERHQANEEMRDTIGALERTVEELRYDLDWRPIALAQTDGTHYFTGHAPTTRTYTPSRYWAGRWEYWNEQTGVWERCGKQPTHFIPIPDYPTGQQEEGR